MLGRASPGLLLTRKPEVSRWASMRPLLNFCLHNAMTSRKVTRATPHAAWVEVVIKVLCLLRRALERLIDAASETNPESGSWQIRGNYKVAIEPRTRPKSSPSWALPWYWLSHHRRDWQMSQESCRRRRAVWRYLAKGLLGASRCSSRIVLSSALSSRLPVQVHNAANANQKEKYEADLKKEIKKLQVFSCNVERPACLGIGPISTFGLFCPSVEIERPDQDVDDL